MKNDMRSGMIGVLCVSFALVLSLTGCGTTINLPSHWPDKPIVVDGKNIEWEHTYLVDDNKLVIACDNDSNFVYLLLATNDRPLTMSIMRGLTVWFDAKGGDDQTFGIRYPLGGRDMRENVRNGDNGDDMSTEPAGQFGLPPTELEILGPDKKDRHRMQIMETGGIQARYNLSVNSLVYELKVPLAMGDKYPFAIHSKVGDIIGIGLGTSQMRGQRPEGGSRRRNTGVEPAEGNDQGEDEGDMMQGGGMRRGGGMGQAGMQGSTGPLDLWMKVKLVPKDTLAQ